MSRIPIHTVEDAPDASRPLLQSIAQLSATGRPLNLHAQMAHSPAVLAAYASLRAVTAEHGTFDPEVSAALALATAATVGNDYVVSITSRLARMNGWTEDKVAVLRTGTTTGDAKIDALTRVVREAAANSGKVTDATWKAAQQAGWSDEQLTEAFAFLGLTVFTGYFLNYAQTDTDL
ncbi:carboxymuconolactone decarboxylase family protein [Cupriavidus basilensis]|uniref:Carboxymuconolactone decarboxylase family protein n=1 Tax=Cupriavidus basilensis TaxID=68895 RepID=A0ABT6AMS7_9BURK|nr:carboxymuconolactone decarboxylase family protein [Cupriavidus basilensis]MDF3833932.1 carboxymuconolactone decarboxylase family protein [Cupriavidus basilensis]